MELSLRAGVAMWLAVVVMSCFVSSGSAAPAYTVGVQLTVQAGATACLKPPSKAKKAVAADVKSLVATVAGNTKTSVSTALKNCSAASGAPVYLFAVKIASTNSRAIASGLVSSINPAATGATVLVPGAAAAAMPKTYALLNATTAVLAAISSSHVISVAIDIGSAQQPYPRGIGSRSLKLSVGGKNYTLTVDTGSSLLEVTCNAPSNGCSQVTDSYTIASGAALTSCAGTGLQCGNPSPGCYYSQGLTGGDGYNGNAGPVVSDTVSFLNVQASGQGGLPFKGIFACSTHGFKCAAGGNMLTCLANAQVCPLNTAQSGFFCNGFSAGIEAGWTFADSSTVAGPSSIAVPQQAFDRGLISQRTVGFCYLDVQTNTQCKATATPNSFNILGRALPKGISYKKLASAPLTNYTFSPPNAGPSSTSTQEFRTAATTAVVPVFNSKTGTTITLAGSTTVLWDTGAYGESTVPAAVYEPYITYFNAAFAAAKAAGVDVTACPDPTSMCGANLPLNSTTNAILPSACTQIALPAKASTSQINKAAKQVLALYPNYVNITLEGGTVAALPGAFQVNNCSGSGSKATTTAVAACSYMRPSTSSQNYIWVAGPWFTNRFVQFDVSKPAIGYPSSSGTMFFTPKRLSTSQCKFLNAP